MTFIAPSKITRFSALSADFVREATPCLRFEPQVCYNNQMMRQLEERLSSDIHLLGDTLGKIIRQQAGIEIFGLEEHLRALTKARRSDNDPEIDVAIANLVGDVSLEQTEALARAFTTYFELINIAEANHRIRVIRAREQDRYPDPLQESIAAAIEQLWNAGVEADELRELLAKLHIELVFTAHPTEAKRRTVLSKLQRIGRILHELETRTLLPREIEEAETTIAAEVTNLWLTARTRTTKPTVTDEVRVGMYYLDTVIWDVIPEIYQAMRQALGKYYPEIEPPDRFLTFGSWMGGDRDGNPFVTEYITAETLRLHRGLAIERHKSAAQKLSRSLSLSERLHPISAELRQWLDTHLDDSDDHLTFLLDRYPNEPYRLVSAILADQLGDASADRVRSRILNLFDEPIPTLKTTDDLRQPLDTIDTSLREAKANMVADAELADFRTQATVFGLQAATLDIRQESSYHDAVLTELLQKLGIEEDYAALAHDDRADLITQLLNNPIPDLSKLTNLSDKSEQTLKLFRVLQRTIDLYGAETIGPHIISMTRSVADVLTVHLLAYWHGINQRDDGAPDGINIAPLFETRADLVAAPEIMSSLFNHPAYQRNLAHFNNEQMIMIGYSDSNKDAGYLTANWRLYEAQANLAECCRAHGILLTLFHGRGGTIARGGGPMKRAILAQPHGSVGGRFRITEQGEVLYERYASHSIARRHLEQIVYSVLMASNPRRDIDIKPTWREALETLSKTAHDKYRGFVYESPELVHYWQEATPIKELSQMRIGSRPAKRAKSADPFAYLRAIPWVFSWMQSRHVLPGWYGVGTALATFAKGNEARLDLLRDMYQNWVFFQAVIDNAQMSLGKADMGIAKLYASLVQDEVIRDAVYGEIKREFDLTERWILHITGQRAILDNERVLQRSVRVRNPYIDPLNFIQVGLLRRYRELETESDSSSPSGTAEAQRLLETIFLTINGIAAGLKNTG